MRPCSNDDRDYEPTIDLGEVQVLPGVREAVEAEGLTIDDLLDRHREGDFGDTDNFWLWEESDRGIRKGGPVVSEYRLPKSRRIVTVYTHEDRTRTEVGW